jgi:hypothetical protein
MGTAQQLMRAPMAKKTSRHATVRMQQRGLPPLVLQWLEDYGAEQYDGHGGIVRFFDKRSRRTLERAVGREPVRRMHEWLDAYSVVAHDGSTITVGRRYRRIWH